MKVMRTGATRLVLLTRKHAIKIPRFDYGWAQGLRGLLANMQETMFSPIADLACPVLFSIPGGWLIVIPKCEPLNDEQWNAVQHRCPGDWMPIPVEYRKRDSFGILNGKLVAVDYGS